MPGDRCSQLIVDAAKMGYRHFDCACDYGNEKEVGRGLSQVVGKNIASREELWVTSKLWNTFHKAEHVRPACEKSLSDLGLEYLDLYLVHFPISLAYVAPETRYPPGWFFDPQQENPQMQHVPVPIRETWEAMQLLVDAGLVKNIGICNFNIALIRDLLSYAKIRPAVLQVELHPHLTQEKLLRYCQQEEIAVTAFSPFGAQSYVSIGMADANENLLEEPVVVGIGQQIQKSPAQVLLRWGVQRDTIVIPKSSSPEHLKENIEIFDFELSSEQIAQLDQLNRNRRYNDPGEFGEKAFNTFYPIYE